MSIATVNTRVALIVRDPFNNYKRGDKIEDAQLIQEILDSDQAHFVNRIILLEPQQETIDSPSDLQSTQNTFKASKKSKE